MRRISDKAFERLMKAFRCQDFLEVVDIFNEELNKGIQEEICPQCPPCTPAVEEVIENFDFEKVHEVMKMLNWKWDGDNPGELPTIPTVEKMKEVVKDLFRSMEDQIAKDVAKSGTWFPSDCTSTGTAGGFRATIDDDVYTLEFVLEEYETDLES